MPIIEPTKLFSSANEIDVACIEFRNIIRTFTDVLFTDEIEAQLKLRISDFLMRYGISLEYTIKMDEERQHFVFNGVTRTDQLVLLVIWG